MSGPPYTLVKCNDHHRRPLGALRCAQRTRLQSGFPADTPSSRPSSCVCVGCFTGHKAEGSGEPRERSHFCPGIGAAFWDVGSKDGCSPGKLSPSAHTSAPTPSSRWASSSKEALGRLCLERPLLAAGRRPWARVGTIRREELSASEGKGTSAQYRALCYLLTPKMSAWGTPPAPPFFQPEDSSFLR